MACIWNEERDVCLIFPRIFLIGRIVPCRRAIMCWITENLPGSSLRRTRMGFLRNSWGFSGLVSSA